MAPVVANISIKGDCYVGGKLEATYDYEDPDGDPSTEKSEYVWLRNNSIIAGSTGKTHQVGIDDSGKIIRFVVIPGDGFKTGEPDTSLGFFIPERLEYEEDCGKVEMPPALSQIN